MKMHRILIVEDEAIVAMEIEDRLTAPDYQIVGRAASGEQALKLAEAQRPDLILMDIRLEGDADGIMTAMEIRRRFHLPVIFLTAYSDDETLERAKLAEPCGFLLKPFDDRELKSAIEIALYKHQAEEEIRRLNRLLGVLSQVNQAIVYSRSREELLAAVCRLLVERGEVDLAWIGWLDPTTSHIRPVAHFGRNSEILQQANFYADDRPEGQGNPGKAVREGKPFLCKSCPGEACFYPAEKQPHRFGFHSCGSFPIRLQGQVGGVLNICASETEFFGDRETELLQEVAADLSFALDKLEAEAQREQAEKALRASEEKFRLAMEVTEEGIWDWNLSTGEQYLSPGFLSVVGYDPGEIELNYQVWEEHVHPEDLPRVLNILQEYLTGKIPSYACEYRVRTKQGPYLWVLGRGRVVGRDPDGAPQRMLGTVSDITEKKLSQAALVESLSLHKATLESTADGILAVNLEGRVASWNQKFIEMWGIPEDIISSRDNNLVKSYVMDQLQDPQGFLAMAANLYANPELEVSDHLHFKDGRIFKRYTRPQYLDNRIVGRVLSFRDVTARLKAEASLKDSEAKYRRIVETASEGIWAMDQDYRTTYVNQVMAEMLGYLPEEMIGQPVTAFMFPEDLEIHQQKMARRQKVLDDKYERRFQRQDGSELWTIVSATALTDAAGSFQGSFAMFTDITERKRMEDALRDNEQFLADIFNGIQDGLSILDRDLNIIRFNPKMTLFPGVQPMVGKKCYEAYHGRSEPCESCPVQITLRTGAPVQKIFKSATVDDAPVFLEIQSFPLLNRITGQVEGAIEYVRDVSERLRLEEQIRYDEQFLKDIFTSIQDGLSILDLDRNIIRANPAMEAFAQSYPMLGRKCYQVYHNRNVPCQICPVEHTLQTREATRGMVEDKADDGNTSFHEIFSYPLINHTTGQLAGAIEYVRDITEQKKVEASLQEIERQLLQAQKMEAIGTLAGGIAHDFNNILWAIMGYTEMALYNVLNADMARQYLDQVLKAGQRAKNLVSQILAFSRRSESAKKPLFLKPIVQEAINLLRASLPATIEICPRLLSESPILADATQLSQVIMNLATNAFHAMEKTGDLLSITLDEVKFDLPVPTVQGKLPPGSYVQLRVEDTGAGIAPDILPRVFEPYFTTKEVGKGTGLGLATVLGIVKSHGGEISLESQPGHGTAFSLYFPIIDQQPDLPIQEQLTLPKCAGRILFIDDEPALAELGKAALTRLGYVVTASTKSREALEIFQARPLEFDLVITDLTMPQLTGLDLAQHLQALRPDLSIIICTGYSELLNPVETSLLGIKEILSKPLSLAQLAETVTKVLQSNRP